MFIGMTINASTEIAHIIQLSVAPVFLVAAVNTLLVVLTSRLARVVDRSRVLDREVRSGLTPLGDEAFYVSELRALDKRMNSIHRAITLATLAVLLISLVIVALFAGELLGIDLSHVIAALFIAAMTALILGLLAFLVEISHASKLLRVSPDLLKSKAPTY
ncbi:MAG: hypothetical protein RL186_1714 [Pseudomonadota bacterium]|jgi:hypothetical protein